MSAVELAVAFVFLSNALFLVAAAYVLQRMTRQARESQEALTQAAERTDAAGRRMRALVAQVAPAPAAAHAGERDGQSAAGVAEVDRLHRQARDLVRRLAALLRAVTPPAGEDPECPAASDTAGALTAQRELDRLQAQHRALRDRMAPLRAELGDALAALARWHRPAPADPADALEGDPEADEEARAAALRQLQAQLEAAQARLSAAHEMPAPDGPGNAPDGPFEAGLDELRGKMSVVECENQSLRRELDELKDLIARTLREKDFIEGRFLLLDQALLDAGAPVPTSGGTQPVQPTSGGTPAAQPTDAARR